MSKNNSVVTTIVIAIVVFIGIGILYNNTHYSTTYEDNFLSSCETSGGTADSCGCALGVIKANYSYQQAKSFDTYVPQYVTDKVTQQCATQ